MLYFLIIILAAQYTLQWQNSYDGYLSVSCSDTQGFYRVRSQYSSAHYDRVWDWYCHNVAQVSFGSDCYWTDWLNGYDSPVYISCKQNYVLAGVQSEHDNGPQDRRWKIRCCHAVNHFTRECSISSYINSWQNNMDYSTSSSRVFTGIFSAHRDAKESVIYIKVIIIHYTELYNNYLYLTLLFFFTNQ